MREALKIKAYAFTLDCKDPLSLARFYAKLLSWDIVFDDGEYACIGAPGAVQGAYPGILFQKNSVYQPPVWPEEKNAQQQMAHLDLAVSDLEKAVRFAVECGASPAKKQFSDEFRVMIDPAGHPFCLCPMKELMDSTDFSLR